MLQVAKVALSTYVVPVVVQNLPVFNS